MAKISELAIADYIRGIRRYVPGRPIEEVERELRTQAIKLASNENPLGSFAAGSGSRSRRSCSIATAIRMVTLFTCGKRSRQSTEFPSKISS